MNVTIVRSRANSGTTFFQPVIVFDQHLQVIQRNTKGLEMY